MAHAAAPPQTVLLTSPPTRSLTQASHLKDVYTRFYYPRILREAAETPPELDFSYVKLLIVLNVLRMQMKDVNSLSTY